MNKKSSLPKTILLALLVVLVASAILPTLFSILMGILPGVLFAACALGGWWVIRRLQGVSGEQAQGELRSVRHDAVGHLQKLTTDTSRAGQAALRAFCEEIRK